MNLSWNPFTQKTHHIKSDTSSQIWEPTLRILGHYLRPYELRGCNESRKNARLCHISRKYQISGDFSVCTSALRLWCGTLECFFVSSCLSLPILPEKIKTVISALILTRLFLRFNLQLLGVFSVHAYGNWYLSNICDMFSVGVILSDYWHWKNERHTLLKMQFIGLIVVITKFRFMTYSGKRFE